MAITARLWTCLVGLAVALGCSPSGPRAESTPLLRQATAQASPTLRPTPIPTPSQNAAKMFGEAEEDVEDAFADQVREVTDEAQYLAGAECDQLTLTLREQPRLVPDLRAFAGVLKRMASRDQVLQRPRSQELLADMDEALEKLSLKLAFCGIRRAGEA